jgi:hypothetical protein
MYGLLFSLYSSIPGYKSAMLKVENNVRKTAPKNIGSL